MSDFAYSAFVTWAKTAAPGRRAVEAVAIELCKVHQLAIKQRRAMPWFTHVSIAARRGKQHRNTSREIIAELAAAPESPLVVHRYSPRRHSTAFYIRFGAWVDRMGRLAMRPLAVAQSTAAAWDEKRRAHLLIVAEAREARRLARQQGDAAARAAALTGDARAAAVEGLRPGRTPQACKPLDAATVAARKAELRRQAGLLPE